MTRQRVPNPELAADTARANLLTNGGFEIWQRGAGPFSAGTSVFSADRWQLYVPSGTTSVSRDAGNGDVSGYCAAVAVTTPGPNGLYQVADCSADLLGRTVSLSVRVKCSQASSVRVGIQSNRAATLPATWSAYHTGGGAYETLTTSLPIPAGSAGITVWLVASVAGTFYLDSAMLVVGDVAADYKPLHPADDLARCLRYYEKIGPSPNAPQMRCYQAAGATFGQTLVFAAKKALTPTMTISGTFGYVNASALSLVAVGVDGTFMSASATAAGDATYYSNGSGYITAEANP